MTDRASEDSRGLAALGTAIETLRSQAGLSEDELAAGAGLDPSLLTDVEAGRREPTWGDLRRISQVLGSSLESLLELAERLENGAPGGSSAG
jgi:transcriptional regulator with XRE-family HTH domain